MLEVHGGGYEISTYGTLQEEEEEEEDRGRGRVDRNEREKEKNLIAGVKLIVHKTPNDGRFADTLVAYNDKLAPEGRIRPFFLS